ncbi:fibronectin [Microbacterium sp. CH12i]|uniref:Ig-like domain-containing protein n=1 Tax=Microbacterium sp. CH12i TaxID=1479651 RepID=UPI000460AE9B|nr:Ig-like domain-containing protein [Microbacterium sp. CH12i]KDA05440.1 fibronectin [Microbacterium sp. CH12i]
MKALTWLRAKPKTIASAASVTVAAVAIATLAFTYEGNPTTKVDLNDGGVWITKSSALMVGHFNNESTLLDGGLRTSGENFDILQDAATILVVDQGNATLTAVDPARVSLADTTTIPGSAKVALGAQTAAVLDPASGDLWVIPVRGLSGFELQGSDPLVELGKNADVAVGQDGTVYALNGDKAEVVTIPVDNEGEALEPSTSSLGEIDTSIAATITVVGQTPVVLSPADSAVMTPGGFRTEIPEADSAVLQQASVATDAVTVATASNLISVPLDGGEPVMTSAGGQGTPAAPVSLLGCTYGAWAGSGKFVRECPSDASDVSAEIPGVEGNASLTFRVNRDVIILNDTVSGSAWLADESLQQVDNWNDLTPPEGETEDEEETTEETVETTLPVRTDTNTPPVAEDDNFGVRPGQTTALPVLDNDNDADGDVLVASLAAEQPAVGTVQPIYDGGSLQIAVDEKASGAASFTYAVNDGRGGEDTATVSLSVKDWDTNTAPKPKRTTTLAIETGGTVSYNVLPDWIDPEGDDIYLKDVLAAPGDEVEFTTDGQITYRATTSTQGRKEVGVTVADALGELTTGTLVLDVRPSGSTLPKTNADHVITRVGEQVTVAPLANDSSSGREQLRLTRVNGDETPGGTIVPDYPNKTFTFSAPTKGVYYVLYEVAAGPNGVQGIVRVDVTDASDQDLPPVAVRDVALLPTGGEVLLGVLNNDTDPAGGILVIQSVTVEPGSGISVSVLNHETLRIGDQGSLDEQARITYRISNGSKTAEGEVVVIPIPAPSKILPPVTIPDQAVVRVNDVVTIPVLDNDTSPIGDALTLQPELIEPFVDPEDGEIFVSQDAVRFKAGSEAKTVYATYEVSDTRGNKVGGYITIQILPVQDDNAAPRPQDITSRVLSGNTANIAVPLDNIDADGDSVELIGLASNPTKGRVAEVAQNYFVYEAYADSAGVDTFSYRVRDRLGKEGTATIRVGIAGAEDVNQAPYAVKDSVVVRPGREVAVPVMLNDSDPEGDKIALVKDALVLPDGGELEARVSGDRVLVQAPDHAAETSLQYTISDARGATAEAVLQITVDENVPLIAPIARDDRLRPTDLADGELTADIDILANDEDPDGTTDALNVTVGTGGTRLEDGKVRVKVGEEMQLIRYTLTDRDDLATSAFIFVPALGDMRPYTTWTKPVEVVSGETKALPLAEYVSAAGGGDVVITEHSKVSAAHADGSDLVKDASTLTYTSAAGYFGEDAITFEVTDGTGPDDPDGRKATLTIPVTVLPPSNQQPTFTRGELNVAAGEPATTLDLAALTNDPDPGDAGKHTYKLVGRAGDGMSARIDGSTLSVEAASNAKKGTAATLTISVSDGETEPIEGAVIVRVAASTRSLATANTDTIDQADQGKTISVPVLSNDVNPFPETPLELVSVATETGDGTAAIKGDQISVTPGAKFVGTLVVRYTIEDATTDVDRHVSGRVVVTVQGVPDVPGRPQVTSVQDRSVVVSFSAPSNNGAEITQYTVSSTSGSAYSKKCASTTCTLDGLTNNVEYTFSVVATNRVGDSEPSAASEIARPDARPDTPTPPTLVFGDKSLKVAWKTPTTPGSPVESYTLQISPAPPSGITEKTGVTGNAMTWEGLENGTSYQVRVQAHNRAPDPSTFSGWSLAMVPAGPPMQPSAPTTAELAPVGSQAQMQVNWVAPNNNGDAISHYALQVMRGGTTVTTIDVPSGQTSQAVVVDTSESGYTYIVRAENKAGWGAWSPASTERRGALRPDAPATPTITAGDGAITITSSYTLNADQRNGARDSEISYQYRLNSSGNWQALSSTTIGGLSNGAGYNLQIRALSNTGDGSYTGVESAPSNSVTPYGIPPQPSASAAKNGAQAITLRWSNNGNNGAAIDTTQINVRGPGGGWGGWETVSASGSRNVGNGYSQNYAIQVRVHNAAGWSSVAEASATTDAPPAPKVWVSKGGFGASCNNGACLKYTVNWENLSIGNAQVWCNSDDNTHIAGHAYTVNFNGTGSQELSCYQGQDNVNVWVDIVGWGTDVDTEKRYWAIP